jgi:hypothetical protein
MAKKDKKKKDKQDSGTSDPVEAVRSAVERTLKATSEGSAGAQKRGRDLVEEFAHAAQRVRESLADRKLLDDLRKEVDSLRARVAALESSRAKPAATTTATRPRTATRATAAKSSSSKPASTRSKSSASSARSKRSSSSSPSSS